MLLSLTELQEMIESSVLEFLANEYDFIKRARSLDADHGVAPQVWRAFAEMGWLGLPLPEADGGIGGRAMECGLLMRAFGRHLVVEPYLNAVLCGTRLIAEAGRAEQRAEWLPELVEGRRRVVLAHDERGVADPWAPRNARALEGGNGFRIAGAKSIVVGASGANAVLVSARTETGGVALFLVPLDAPGVTVEACRMLDGARAADLRFDDVQVDRSALLGEPADASGVLGRIIAEAIVSECWEACGAMKAALEQTAEYTQQRVQFGKSISSFQVVQHRLAEMAVCCEEALAACQLAALSIERDAASAVAAAAMAKSKVGRGARFVAQEAVQLHGAMGVSEELPIASYFRKLLAFAQRSGGTAWAGQRYGELMLLSDAWRDSRTLPSLARA
ncbi:acyl-CoA dehydrogenase family protein [Aromatoleum petrolei]|uniref:Acyl-CoA dehydrogenase n=1 Tax=Aromatoleum petrolei TaxID=76116 RepID=A0ABX1MTB8_9RHOO|nr:acyl-CoA dehydrogenase [Aromatoleum petrolei]NMF89565.1 acyl-CoA dehydrogenase [Aromatoleum petrolei]QTQ37342.1 Acyl-CoA dehydrogenase/oxidase [Aromatoleum petrolei]